MTDKQLNRFFDVAKNEPAQVSPNDIANWVDKKQTIKPSRKRFLLPSLIIGISALLALLMCWQSGEKPTRVYQPKKEKTHVLPKESNKSGIVTSDWKETRNIQKPHLANLSKGITTTDKKDSIHTLPFEIDSVIKSVENELPEVLFSPEKILSKSENLELSFQPFALQAPKEIRNVLMILDTILAYRSATKFKMDQTDCYLQLYNDYVVISYQFRGKFFYASGKIHREETVEVNGHVYRAFAFQRDNQVTGTNLGKRLFFGYRELEPESNRIEVVMFNQPWAVTTVIKGHFADLNERKQLMERSHEQNRKRKNQ
jgi:hypothetical protein